MHTTLSTAPAMLCLVLAAVCFYAAGTLGSAAIRAAALMLVVVAWSRLLLASGLGRRLQTATPTSAGEATASASTSSPTAASLETLFWSHITAVLMFAFGAGLALDDAFDRMLDPRPLSGMEPMCGVLGITAVLLAVAAFSPPVSAPAKLRREALVALAAPTVALVFLGLGEGTGPADGLGALVIAMAMVAMAAVTALEARRLLAAADAGWVRPVARPARTPLIAGGAERVETAVAAWSAALGVVPAGAAAANATVRSVVIGIGGSLAAAFVLLLVGQAIRAVMDRTRV